MKYADARGLPSVDASGSISAEVLVNAVEIITQLHELIVPEPLEHPAFGVLRDKRQFLEQGIGLVRGVNRTGAAIVDPLAPFEKSVGA